MRELYRYQTKQGDKFGEKWEGMIEKFKDNLEKRQAVSCYTPGGSLGPATCTTTVFSTELVTTTYTQWLTTTIIEKSICPTITEPNAFTTTITTPGKCEASVSNYNSNSSDLSLSNDSRFALAIALPLSVIAGIGIVYFIWKAVKSRQNPRTIANVATNEERHGNQVVEN